MLEAKTRIGLDNIFEKLSVKELLSSRKLIDKIIKEKTPSDRLFIGSLNIDDFVSYEENFLNENELIGINEDFKKVYDEHTQDTGGHKTKSLWLSHTNEPYEWKSEVSGKLTINRAIPFSQYKNIDNLLQRINSDKNLDLNSCLIQYYPDGQSGIRLHDDSESTMDPSKPIIVVSSGSTRTIEFFHNYQRVTEPPRKSIQSSNGSMYIMKPQCQDYFKHRVPSTKNYCKTRFSLSFRRILTPSEKQLYEYDPEPVLEQIQHQKTDSEEKSPVKEMTSLFEKKAILATEPPPIHHKDITNDSDKYYHHIPQISAPSVTPKPNMNNNHRTNYFDQPQVNLFRQGNHSDHYRYISGPKQKNTVLLFGTSITKWVNADMLSQTKKCINISESGAKLAKFPRMVEDFATTNIDISHDVGKVIFSLGTNDVKLFKQDVSKFRQPIKYLINITRKCFGNDIIICFQSLLPMKVMYKYTASNFLGFNNILQDMCMRYNCIYFDCFEDFLDGDGRDFNRFLYNDPLHLNRYGLSILCQHFKTIINNYNVDRNLDNRTRFIY